MARKVKPLPTPVQKEMGVLPMDEEHKEKLTAHWRKLQVDFRIETAR